MQSKFNDTLNPRHFPWITLVLLKALSVGILMISLTSPIVAEERDEEDIEIVEGEDRTTYEYRQNGILTMIKVVPKNGRPYYMVPADGAPHYENLDHKNSLYPQWVIVEF